MSASCGVHSWERKEKLKKKRFEKTVSSRKNPVANPATSSPPASTSAREKRPTLHFFSDRSPAEDRALLWDRAVPFEERICRWRQIQCENSAISQSTALDCGRKMVIGNVEQSAVDGIAGPPSLFIEGIPQRGGIPIRFSRAWARRQCDITNAGGIKKREFVQGRLG